MRASPARPLAFRTSTVMAGPRSPGMGWVCVESPPQPETITATRSAGVFMTVRSSDRPTVRPVDSRTRSSRAAMASRSEGATRFCAVLLLGGWHPARPEHAAPGPPDPGRYGRAPAPGSPPDTASVPRRPSRASRRCETGRRPARRDPAPHWPRPDLRRPAHEPEDRETAHRGARHGASRRGASGPAPSRRRAWRPPSCAAVRRPARYGRDARATLAPMPASSRRDSRVRADALAEDDAVEETGLSHPRRHHGDGVGRDAADGLQVFVDKGAVLRGDIGDPHRVQTGALDLCRIRFAAAPRLLEGPERARQRDRGSPLVWSEIRVAR